MANELKAGDVVKLKHSGTQGVSMSVEKVYTNADGDEVARCVWFYQGEFKRENIIVNALRK
ncbi:DUF2158 domain-containing protein [Sphingobacterium psychroaquaticum]|uniref:DUF2158 domain-containing protein n=1 Tax=Sphingobacterium psychroaquaticum TaxID=561061 RepID=UPI0010698CE2|nr:DUF2158 domain-containing protein [Sphingobacterium psychroaquaticum]QBQ41198.1 DUF2158 domain-containing protein [Sphingobacterium psychroaquaticum]